MTDQLKQKLDYVNGVLAQRDRLDHACRVLNYDMETICPQDGMEEQGETIAAVSNMAFKLTKEQAFIDAAEALYAEIDAVEDEYDRALVKELHAERLKTKNITPEMDKEFSLVFNGAFVNWLKAKKTSDFSAFAPWLEKVRGVNLRQIALREGRLPNPYDNLLDDYERGLRCADLDALFDSCKARLLPLLRRIGESKKRIRTDFLGREVSDEQQKRLADYLLRTMGFDLARGALALSEHPFTDALAKDDVRITTHYYPQNFASSMYSVIHEGGHALFEMFQPRENWAHHLQRKTLGMHESVSRFYENIVGRSRAFVHLVYPKIKEIMPQVLRGVSERELYEALNVVRPSLIRVDADEFTYTFHIIIRYEIEKEIVNGGAEIAGLPALWNKKYAEYLGVDVPCDRDGVLQDVHWTGGFGYFATYSLGNFYGAMYYKRMNEDFPVEEAVARGDFAKINAWLSEHVWKMADRLDPKEWIQSICGKSLSEKDFLDYLEAKYSELYGLG